MTEIKEEIRGQKRKKRKFKIVIFTELLHYLEKKIGPDGEPIPRDILM